MPIESYLVSFLYYIVLDDMPIGSYLVGFLCYIALDNMSIESYSFGFSLLYSIRIGLSC